MDQPANLKVVRLLLSTFWLSTIFVSVISYPVTSSHDDYQDLYESESPLSSHLNWIRYLLSAQDKRLTGSKNPVGASEEHTEQKRMQFGFSGLDTLDHILTTLDRKQKPAGSGERSSKMDKDIYYLMKVNG